MFRPDRPAWLRVATSVVYFAIVGPLIGCLIALVPLILILPLAAFMVAPIMPQVFLMMYPACMAPAAITGAYAALVSPAMRPPALMSFYVSTSIVGGVATFLCLTLSGTVNRASDASALLGIATIGALSAAICAGVAHRWPLGRVQ